MDYCSDDITYQYVGSIEECVYVEDSNGNDDDGGGGGYNPDSCTCTACDVCGGCLVDGLKSASTENCPPNCTCPPKDSELDPVLKKLFTDWSALDSTDIKELNEVFNKMNLDCMSQTVTNYLTSNNVTLGTISIDPTMSVASAAIDVNSGDLTFAGDWAITEKNLSHEWFHLGQREMNDVTDDKDGYMEFENWLLADIKETIRVEGVFDSSNHQFACYKHDMDVYETQYQNWLMSITENGTTYPTSFNDMNFCYWGPRFAKEVRTEYSFLNFTNTSYSPKTMFDLIYECH